MAHSTIKTVRLTALAASLALMAAACGGDDSGGSGGNAAGGGLDGASITVGSKEFTEQLILGQMAILALEDAGASVNDETGIVGTDNVRAALTSGAIDLYWEYTGTGWTVHLGHEATEAPTDPQKLFDQVAEEDLQKNNVKWFALSPVNNTYAIATVADRAEELGVSTLSDYAGLVADDPSAASLCAATEFLTRADGWPGVEQAYNFDLPDSQIAEVDLGIVFTRVPEGDPCNFGEVFSTDGRIPANDMVVLEDDKDFFVKYNLAMTAMQDTFEQHPELEDVFTPIAEALSTETMAELNAQVDDEGLPPEAVAEAWLEDNGFIG
ncbi:MAG TPA: glycine betaine ABC transporter substrate-binding protein [Nocardioidaceae bacterium]|nr:glycine betaine ABC transporter substrate-binding protein [Nocardioidaceae bacterium]